MVKLLIDGTKIQNKTDLFVMLKEQIDSEQFIGNNLDALYDVLQESGETVEVKIIEPAALRTALGNYTDRLLKVLYDCGMAEGEEQEKNEE